MSYYLTFIFILILGVDFSYLFKRGFGQTAALSNFVLIFFLYVGGLCLDMLSAMYVFLVFVLALTIYSGYKIALNKDLQAVKKILINPAFIIYALLGLALGIIFINRVSNWTDEFSHWALVSKNMFLTNTFGNVGDTSTMFNRYEPATGVYMYAFQVFGSEFCNGALYSAFDLLLMSLMLPVIEIFDKKLTLTAILFTFFAFVIPVIFKAPVYWTILVDSILGIMCAYIFLIYRLNRVKKDGFAIANIALASFVLTLVKSSGIAFVAFAFIFILCDVLTRGRAEAKEFFKDKANFVYMLLPIVFILFAKLSWSWYVDFYETRAGWDASELTLPNIIEWLKNPTPYQSTVTENFFKTFFIGKIKYDGGLRLPQLLVLPLAAGACVVLGLKTKNKAFAISQGIVMWIVLLGYGISLLLLYLFSFAYGEGLRLASYPRYYISILTAVSLILYYEFAEIFGIKPSEKNHAANEQRTGIKKLTTVKFASGVAILSVIFSIAGYFESTAERKKIYEPYNAWLSTVEKLNPNEDSVYIVVSDEDLEKQSQIYIRMRYYATPVNTSGYLEGGSYAEGRDAKICWTGNPFAMSMGDEKFKEQVGAYNYLYLHDVQDGFEDNFGEFFEDEIKDDSLYKVEKDDEGNISLVLA